MTWVRLTTIMAVQATQMPWGMELPTATSQQGPLVITCLNPARKSSLEC